MSFLFQPQNGYARSCHSEGFRQSSSEPPRNLLLRVPHPDRCSRGVESLPCLTLSCRAQPRVLRGWRRGTYLARCCCSGGFTPPLARGVASFAKFCGLSPFVFRVSRSPARTRLTRPPNVLFCLRPLIGMLLIPSLLIDRQLGPPPDVSLFFLFFGWEGIRQSDVNPVKFPGNKG